jgi:hypothetical protein
MQINSWINKLDYWADGYIVQYKSSEYCIPCNYKNVKIVAATFLARTINTDFLPIKFVRYNKNF